MRIDNQTHKAIKDEVCRLVGESARIHLFGSRTDDSKRGGDIDLLIETDEAMPNRAEALCHLHGALTLALGDRRLDILLKDGRTVDAPIFEIAKRTGIVL